MSRFLIFILSMFTSALAFAEGPPNFFEPAPKDVSLYYLGEIFGNGLVSGGAETYLLSDMFEIFNLVCLVVAIVLIIYTAIVGVLHTSGQGKVLGEKWSATFLPIRVVLGMALLVPTPGSGYVLAQSIVMWMAIQGIGAADQLWNAALDYFIEGGAVYTKTNEPNTAPLSASYMNRTNVENTYELERVILVNATCVAAHNSNEDAAKLMGEYEIYQTQNPVDGLDDYVNFGNPDAWDPAAGGNAGRECGYIKIPSFVADNMEQVALMHKTYSDAFYYMSRGLRQIAEFLASEDGSDAELWDRHFQGTQYEAVAYIEYLNAASHILNPNQPPPDTSRAKLEKLKEYGWLLAGNYYMTLTNISEDLTGISLYVNSYDTVKEPPDSAYDQYPQALENAEYYWEAPPEDPRAGFSFSKWGELYKIPGYGDLTSQPVEPLDQNEFTYKDLHFIEDSLTDLGTMTGVGSVTNSGGLTIVNKRDPLFYLNALTNFGGETIGDPIVHAAEFGGKLTKMAVVFFMLGMVSFLVIIVLSAWSGPCLVTSPFMATLSLILVGILAPFIFGVASFMYIQGALLSVALPLIPFVIFFIAGLGWFIATIEMVVSAPLVAVGLVFPETNQDIWGKAEPAFMMILNLFLRPPLIILGFVFGMILTWIAIELLNAVFYLFLKNASFIENMLFGWLTVIMAYIYILLNVVEKTFSITTELPNKVLLVLGDRSQAQPGAETTVTGMKEGAEKGAGAVGGFMAAGGGIAERGVSTAAEKRSAFKKEQEEMAQRLAASVPRATEGNRPAPSPETPHPGTTPGPGGKGGIIEDYDPNNPNSNKS